MQFVSLMPDNERIQISIPEELPKAWLYLIMTLLSKSPQTNERLGYKFEDLIDIGLKRIVQQIGKQSLSQYSVLPPSQLLSVVNRQLLNDLPGHFPAIDDVYNTYMHRLVSTPNQ